MLNINVSFTKLQELVRDEAFKQLAEVGVGYSFLTHNARCQMAFEAVWDDLNIKLEGFEGAVAEIVQFCYNEFLEENKNEKNAEG
jgi:hypothetical protein